MKEKILVYDCSFFGQKLRNYCRKELEVQVELVMDVFRPQEMSDREICRHVAEKLTPYVGAKRAILIVNPLVVSVVVGELEKIFPEQIFVYYGGSLDGEICSSDKVAILALERVRRSQRYQAQKAAYQGVEISELDCEKWVDLIDRGWMGRDELFDEFRHRLGVKVLIYHQALLLREKKIEEVVDWRGEMIDVKKGVLLECGRRIKRD